jgi:UPF0755 protein
MSLHDVLPGSEPGAGRGRPPSRRSSARATERRKRRKRRRSWLALLLTVVVVGGGVSVAWLGLRPLLSSLNEPDDWTGPGTGSVSVRIQPGDTGVRIGRQLVAQGVVKTSKAYVAAARAEPRSNGIQPGTYRLRTRMSSAAALAALLDPASRVTRSIRITEGERAAQIYAQLEKDLGFTRAEVQAAARDVNAIGLPAAARGNPEGFLFPATYDFEPDDTPTDVLAAMVQRTVTALQQSGAPESGWRTVVTKASIIQAEAARVADMGKVSRVLSNRLAAKRLLQLDSTVSYATNRFGVTTTDRERRSRSRYNTYLYHWGRSATRGRTRSTRRCTRPPGSGSSSSPSTRTPGRPSSPSPRPSTTGTRPSSRPGCAPTPADLPGPTSATTGRSSPAARVPMTCSMRPLCAAGRRLPARRSPGDRG